MENLLQLDKNETYKILTRVANAKTEVHFKEQNSDKILKSTLFKNTARKQFFLENRNLDLDHNKLLTFKIIIDQKLYFLKTYVKKGNIQFYFENINDMFELIRRKKPRYLIPEHWAQAAKIHNPTAPADLKSPATILDMSKSGMRLHVRADLPRYQKGDEVLLYFKVYRRAEIVVKSKIIYLSSNQAGGGPVMGLSFLDSTILISNKIQNVCDDLAFYWTSESDVQKQ